MNTGTCLDCRHSHRWHAGAARCRRGGCLCRKFRTEPTKARRRFWLDGGYDRDSVEACPYHPYHWWVPVRVGDMLAHPAPVYADEIITICKGCYVPRCGDSRDRPERCLFPRHHDEPHSYASGRTEPIGGIPR